MVLHVLFHKLTHIGAKVYYFPGLYILLENFVHMAHTHLHVS